jgi:integrase
MPHTNSVHTVKKSYFQTFIDSLDKSKETKRMYQWSLNTYCKWLGIADPNQLITKDLLTSGEAVTQLEDQIIDFITYMKNERNLVYSTIHSRLAAIYHFYTINRVRLNKDFISKFKPANRRVRQDKAYSVEQIRKMYDRSTERDKVIVLLMASVGLRIGALPTITIGDLTKVHPPGYMPQDSYIYKITIYPKESEEYYSFCTFETTNAIDRYLEYRQQNGEELTPKAPLLRKHFRSVVSYKKGSKRLSNNARYSEIKDIIVAYKTFNNIIDRIVQRAGLRTAQIKKKHELHEVMASHGFRKFCVTQMVKAKLEYNIREFLVGHRRTTGLDRHYDRTSEEDRLREWVKAMDYLTISRENKLLRQVQEQDHTIQVQMAKKEEQIQMLLKWKEQMEVLLNEPDKFMQMLQEGRGKSK